MTHNEAERILGLLVGGTPGWNSAPDETFTVYSNQISTLHDVTIALAAVETIIRTHPGPARPTVAQLFNEYRTEARRRAMDAPALPSPSTNIVTIREGRAIAARAYAAQCRSRDPETDVHILSGWRSNEPSSAFLDAMLGNGAS